MQKKSQPYQIWKKSIQEKVVFSWLKVIVLNRYEEEKCEGNFQKHISHKLLIQFYSDLIDM